jgi:hypothetical protein
VTGLAVRGEANFLKIEKSKLSSIRPLVKKMVPWYNLLGFNAV